MIAATLIEPMILEVRGQRVLLDFQLAEMYGVTTGALNQAFDRNRDRFPLDFVLRLTPKEVVNLKSQSVISSSGPRGWGGRRSLPYAFTEQGVAMLSSVLRSPRAVAVNIEIMRAFVRLRRILSTNADLSRRLDELESKYDGQFRIVFDAIRALMQAEDNAAEEERARPRIGFRAPDRAIETKPAEGKARARRARGRARRVPT